MFLMLKFINIAKNLSYGRIGRSACAPRYLLLQVLNDGAQFVHNGRLALVNNSHQRRGYRQVSSIAFSLASICIFTTRILHCSINKFTGGFPFKKHLQFPPQHLVLKLQL
jgi:hypothetical protein